MPDQDAPKVGTSESPKVPEVRTPAPTGFVGGVREREVKLSPEMQAALTLKRGLPMGTLR